ncbi:hypothetical protein EO244_16710 [Ancylomarina salipaludis]|uniref:Uncharacterized protein n=1 Tax=Ancylomarina salipaludis TaxID=2501299 RepID=A0A4Q1JHH4_9BACT|nr:hypothetical protein [Ancylomarina salipaludis]RXQ87121.1 hypothetical protein EO244_16710 [Ancylomarina salipaludis]
MDKTNLYIVHNAIFSMNKIPLGDNRNMRPHLNKLFNNNYCFREHRLNILNPFQENTQSLPFIKNLGLIVFNPKSMRLSSSGCCERELLAQFLGGREEYNNPEAPLQNLVEIDEDWDEWNLFGYNAKLDDQRHNYLYFELAKSLPIKCIINGKCIATGKVHTHIYPFGYIVISFALNIDYSKTSENIKTILKETRLNRNNKNWKWRSKFGELPLSEILNNVKKSILESFFDSNSIPSTRITIETSIKHFDNIASELDNVLKGENQKFSIDEESNEYFKINPQGLLVNFSNERTNKSALRFFWKINTIFEYAFIQKRIMHDYKNYLTDKVQELKEYRFQLGKKLLEEDIAKFSVFEPTIPRFINDFNAHIKAASPFHRRIYYEIEKGINLKHDKEKFKTIINEWEQEIEKWEHPIKVLWKKFLSPLRSLLGG